MKCLACSAEVPESARYCPACAQPVGSVSQLPTGLATPSVAEAAELAGLPQEFHAPIFEAIEKRFASRGLKVPAINRRQAMVPRGAVVLPNPNGLPIASTVSPGFRKAK